MLYIPDIILRDNQNMHFKCAKVVTCHNKNINLWPMGNKVLWVESDQIDSFYSTDTTLIGIKTHLSTLDPRRLISKIHL